MIKRLSREERIAYRLKAELRKRKREEKAKTLWSGKKRIQKDKPRSHKWLLRELNRVFSLYIRTRDASVDNGRCLICHVRPIGLMYHLVPSNEGAACRYIEDNVVGACYICNGLEKNYRRRYWLIHVKLFGEEKMMKLDEISQTVLQLKRYDYVRMIDHYAQKLAKLQEKEKPPEESSPPGADCWTPKP